MKTSKYVPQVGDEVGAHRWPYDHAHPDCWAEPWKGEVVAITDPRAWANTMAFPRCIPTSEEVATHLRDLVARGISLDHIPVLWEFRNAQGVSDPKVMWEKVGTGSEYDLRPYADDLAAWRRARAMLYDRELRRRSRVAKLHA